MPICRTPDRSIVSPLESLDGREEFRLIVRQSRIDMCQHTYQNMARQTIVLARLDIDGPPHTNPDRQTIPCPHLHIYREGWGDKWATPVDPLIFTDRSNLCKTLQEFFVFCNITEAPLIAQGLFH
jgi:hypothetical protein